jgi:hypothetical protein
MENTCFNRALKGALDRALKWAFHGTLGWAFEGAGFHAMRNSIKPDIMKANSSWIIELFLRG